MFEAKKFSSKKVCFSVLIGALFLSGVANSQSIVDIEADIEADIEKQLQEERDKVSTEQTPSGDDSGKTKSEQPLPAPPCVNYPLCDGGGGT